MEPQDERFDPPVRSLRQRPRRTVLHKAGRFAGALGGHLADRVSGDVAHILGNLHLFLGLAALIVGLLSFASDHYCDGNASAAYACTRPATYYYYPWWAILLVLVGAGLVTLWCLRRAR